MLQENPSTIFNVNVFVISFVGLTNSKMGINSYLGDKQMEKNYPNIFKARFFSGLSLTSSLNMSSILISWFFCLIFFFFLIGGPFLFLMGWVFQPMQYASLEGWVLVLLCFFSSH